MPRSHSPILFSLGLCLIFSLGVILPSHAKHSDKLSAITWMQTSAEFHAITTQTYQLAAQQIEPAILDPSWSAALEQFGQKDLETLPTAVILDLDDTIISSMQYRAYLELENKKHSRDAWEAWISVERAPLIPGVKAFIKKAAQHNVKIMITSNRICLPTRQDKCPIKTQTRAMLKHEGLIFDQDDLLFRNEQPDWRKDKSTRRTFIAQHYRILLIIGDDLSDMIPNAATSPTSSRLLYTEQYQEFWGSRWFMLPNSVYGSWRSTASKDLSNELMKYPKK